jgi:DNA modification methylase
MEIREKEIKELIEAEYNPRRLTKDQYKQLKDSLLRFGVVDPVLVNINEERKNIIIGGHQRTKVWSDLGNKTIPCVELNLTLDQEKELNVRLNKNTGEFDFDMLANYFEETELIEWGFDEEELDLNFDEEEPEAEEDDYQQPDEVQTNIVEGDLITFEKDGKELHRLLCGDSTKKEDVERLMNGEKADMVFTDPPYNISFSGSMSNTTVDGVMVKHKGANQQHDIIENDKMTDDEFLAFMISFLENLKLICKGAYYISFGAQTLNQLLNPLEKTGFKYKAIIIWMKNQATLSGKDYKSRYEPIVYGRFNDCFYAERYKQEDIWEFQRTLKNDLHPTMKPIPLIEEAIKNSSLKDNIVTDFFLGSGSTMVASHQLNRKCYGLELTPKYCQVITDRMKALDSDLIIKINGKEYE